MTTDTRKTLMSAFASWLPFRLPFGRLAFVACALTPLFAGACWDDHPCDPDHIIKDNLCYPAPPPPPPPKEGGGDVIDTFGQDCETQEDCAGGNATVCGAPQLPMCTQINCQAGEENQGVCPSGWTCLLIPPNPSVCLKQ